MVLEKASPEENSGYKNAESDSSSENEKHQKYEIEVCRTFVLLFYSVHFSISNLLIK